MLSGIIITRIISPSTSTHPMLSSSALTHYVGILYFGKLTSRKITICSHHQGVASLFPFFAFSHDDTISIDFQRSSNNGANKDVTRVDRAQIL